VIEIFVPQDPLLDPLVVGFKEVVMAAKEKEDGPKPVEIQKRFVPGQGSA
jgi:hypothetical protein